LFVDHSTQFVYFEVFFREAGKLFFQKGPAVINQGPVSGKFSTLSIEISPVFYKFDP